MIKRQTLFLGNAPWWSSIFPDKKRVLKKLNLYDRVNLIFTNGGLLKNVWNYISIKVTN